MARINSIGLKQKYNRFRKLNLKYKCGMITDTTELSAIDRELSSTLPHWSMSYGIITAPNATIGNK